MIMGLFSSFWACGKLTKPGVSREVRMLVLKRHISYIGAYFFCNIYLIIQAAQTYNFRNGTDVLEGTWWINVSEILYFLQGVIIPALRVVEPYFFVQAWHNFKMPFVMLFRCMTCKRT